MSHTPALPFPAAAAAAAAEAEAEEEKEESEHEHESDDEEDDEEEEVDQQSDIHAQVIAAAANANTMTLQQQMQQQLQLQQMQQMIASTQQAYQLAGHAAGGASANPFASFASSPLAQSSTVFTNNNTGALQHMHMEPKRKGKWLPEQDQKLREAVALHGGKNW